MAKVFTLPADGVGSIIEYRYKLRYDDSGRAIAVPDWFVQSDLYTRQSTLPLWRPTSEQLISDERTGRAPYQQHLVDSDSS